MRYGSEGQENKMKGEEIKYAIAFDANKEFKEIHVMDGPSEPLAAEKGSVHVFTQREFKRLIESAMRCYTEPVEAKDRKGKGK